MPKHKFTKRPVSTTPFIEKLSMLVNLPDNQYIWWTDNGREIVFDRVNIHLNISKYFKSNKLTSFIRQLNSYGFYKTSINVFKHEIFYRGNHNQYHTIKNKRISYNTTNDNLEKTNQILNRLYTTAIMEVEQLKQINLFQEIMIKNLINRLPNHN